MSDKYILLIKNPDKYKYAASGDKAYINYKAGQFRLKNIITKILKIIFK